MLQTLCLAKKNKYKFCSTTISCNSRLSIVAYVKQSNMIANNFSSQSTAKGKKGLTKKKAAGNVRFHAKKKAIKGATKSKKVLSVVANKFTAKSKWMQKRIKALKSIAFYNSAKAAKKKSFRIRKLYKVMWSSSNPSKRKWWLWKRLGPLKLTAMQLKKKSARKNKVKKISGVKAYFVTSARMLRPTAIKAYFVLPSLYRAFKETVQKWRHLRRNLKPYLSHSFQNHIFRHKPIKLRYYRYRRHVRRLKRRLSRSQATRRYKLAKHLKAIARFRRFVKKVSKVYQSRSKKMVFKRYCLRPRGHTRYQRKFYSRKHLKKMFFSKKHFKKLHYSKKYRKKAFHIRKRFRKNMSFSSIRTKPTKKLFRHTKLFFKKRKFSMSVQYKNFPKCRKDILKKWYYLLNLKKSFYSKPLRFVVAKKHAKSKIKWWRKKNIYAKQKLKRRSSKALLLASIKPVTHISFNRLSPLSFLNLQKRGYKTHKQVDKSNTPKKAQRSPFDFTRKNAIIYTASFKALQEQASDIEGKKQLRKRLNLEKRLGRLNNKYLRIYGKFWSPITPRDVWNQRIFWRSRKKYFKKKYKFTYRKWKHKDLINLVKKIRRAGRLSKFKQKFMREKSLVRKLVRYFTKYVRKHKVRRRNPKYKKYVRFFSTAFSTPFSVLASKANIKRRKRHKFRIKGSRLTAVFKKYRSLKGIETLQRQLRLSEKKINLSSGSKVFKYTKKSLHAKFINSTTTALKISNALLYQNKINKELLHLNSSSRRHVRSFKPYYKSKRFRWYIRRTYKKIAKVARILNKAPIFKNAYKKANIFFKTKEMLPLKKTSDHLDPFNFLRYDRRHKALRLSEKFMDAKPFNTKSSLKTTLSLSYLKSNFYNRAYLRNRVRTTLARRRRVRLTRKATAMTAPKAYIRGAKAKFLSKRAFWLKKRSGKKIMHRSKYLRNTFAASTAKVTSVLLNSVSKTYLKARSMYEKQRTIKALPYFVPTYKLIFRRWHAYRDRTGSPLPRAWLSKADKRRWAVLNKLRARKGKKKSKKKPDPVFKELETMFGTMSSIGYLRKRRVLSRKHGKAVRLDTVTTPLNLATPNTKKPNQFKVSVIKKADNLSGAITSRKAIRQYGLKRINNWRMYTDKALQLQQRHWRFSDVRYTDSNSTWSLPYMTSVIQRLISEDSRLTTNISKLLDINSSKQLIEKFVKHSSLWLSERYSERQLYNKLISLSSFDSNVTKLVLLNRKELFRVHPFWWTEEAKRRLSALCISLNSFLGNNNLKTVPTITNILARANQYYSGSTSLEITKDSATEKELLKYTLSLFPATLYNSLRDQSLQNVYEVNSALKLQTTYDFWLTTAVTSMKKVKKNQYGRVSKFVLPNVSFNVGTDQSRFPGTGRRRNSYDSALRLFYKKTSLSKFRRVQPLRFVRVRPVLNDKSYSRVSKTSALRRRKSLFNKDSLLNMYFSRSWRRLQNLRTKMAKTGASTKGVILQPNVLTKRRLASSTIQLTFDQKVLAKTTSSVSATVERLMLTGIKARRRARQLQNLVLHANRRVPSREQILPPSFVARKKRNRRKARSLKKNRYVRRSLQKGSDNAHWSIRNFSLNVIKKRFKKDLNKSNIDEITVEKVAISRKPKASRRYTATRIQKKFYKQTARRRFRRRPFVKVGTIKPFRKKRRWFTPRSKTEKALFRRRKGRFYSNRSLKRVAARRLLKREWLCNNSFGYRLLNNSYSPTAITPLQFVKKTGTVVISAEEKHRQFEDLEHLRQDSYKRAEHFAAALTQLFPQLISFIIDKQLTSKLVSSKELRGMVAATYWSLRFYLQNNFSTTRKATKETYSSKIIAVRNQLIRDAENYHFDAKVLKRIRQRYQPYSLKGRISLRRGALDWLRMFFPRFHALYLEDPEEYKKFFLSATQVMRAHPARINPGKWATNKIASPMESKYKRLLKSGGIHSSKHFENVLITAKRFPILTGYGPAINMRSGSINNSTATPRSSFFRRSYSTSTVLCARREAVDLRRIYKISQHVPASLTSLSDYKALSLKQRLINHVYSKAKTYKLGNSSEIDSITLDPRFIRLKSPRSGHFIQRLPLKYKSNLNNSISAHSQETNAAALFVRRSVRMGTPRLEERQQLATARVENKMRKNLNTLNYRSRAAQVTAFKPRRLYTDKSRAQRYDKSLQLQWHRKLLNVKKLNINKKFKKITDFKKQDFTNCKIATTKRSVLHYRRADQRSLKKYFVKAPIVLHSGIILKPRARIFLASKKVFARLISRTYKARQKRAITLFRRRSSSLFYKKAVGNIPTRSLRIRTKAISFAHRLSLRKNFNLRFQYLNKFIKKIKTFKQTYKHSKIFVSQARRIYKNKRLISKFFVNKEDNDLNDPNTERRGEVWDLLTLRWLKKRRVLKNWLKNAKRRLKRNKWKFMPETVFKGMRVRLRKLGWREPDGHFSRNLRYAFRFYPKERRKAPWLEKLMYRRSLYSTIRGAYRRYQIPREQKRLKWLQSYRRSVVAPRRRSKYLRARRWPRLRIYNQRLYRSLFSLKNKRVAQRHFKKLSRHKARTNGFSKALSGLGDRLDVNLILLNIAPTIFWARVLATFGLFKINNKTIYDPAYRFKPRDRIFWNWELIERLRIYFQRPLREYEVSPLKTSITFPKNFKHFPNIKTSIYLGLPRPEDLRKNSRLSPFLFKLFKADAGFGRQ